VRLLAACTVALVFAAPAFASDGRLTLTGPPKGTVKIEAFSIKATKQPKIAVTDLAALGKDFAAAGLIGKSKTAPGRYVVYLVMFMGSLSTTGTVSLQITGGTPTGTPMDDTKDCTVITSIYDGSYRELVTATGAIFGTGDEDRGSLPRLLKSLLRGPKDQQGCK
jgi:hypothetical protein